MRLTKGFILTLLYFLSFPEATAQTGLIRTIELKGISQVVIDRAGDLYVITTGVIKKFDKDGKQLNETTIDRPPTSFDTGNGVRLLAYNRNSQQYTILTPTLSKITETSIDHSIAIDPVLTCSSGDYNMLVLDAADWSIKKADTREPRVISEFKIDSTMTPISSIVMMREYQNFIFLLDKQNGISIFNGIGIKIKSLNVTDLRSFNFLGEELYYYKDGGVHFFDLFTTETRTENIPGSFESVLLTDERLVGINSDRIEIYKYPAQ